MSKLKMLLPILHYLKHIKQYNEKKIKYAFSEFITEVVLMKVYNLVTIKIITSNKIWLFVYNFRIVCLSSGMNQMRIAARCW